MNIDQLSEQWQRLKHIEQEAANSRKEIEERIAQLIEMREEGVSTQETERFKVKATSKLNRTLDSDSLQDQWKNLPESVRSCVKWKPSLDTTSFRSLSATDEAILSQHMTTKPAKPTFKVESL